MCIDFCPRNSLEIYLHLSDEHQDIVEEMSRLRALRGKPDKQRASRYSKHPKPKGEDDEDTELLNEMAIRAKDYITSFKWCDPLDNRTIIWAL